VEGEPAGGREKIEEEEERRISKVYINIKI